jgi:hypothetical protein
MSTELTLHQGSNMDAVDRFFGFTETFLCGQEHSTANIILDPAALEREEHKPMFSCGGDDKIIAGDDDDAGIMSPPGGSSCCGGCLGTTDSHEVPLTSEGSVGTNQSKDSTNRRRRFWALLRCNGRDRENDVIH